MTLLSIPGNPVPEGAIAGTIGTPDGVTLRFARWAAPENGRGTVCVFAGRGEYIEKYFETAKDLRKRGYAVATIDWRGQGHSSRRLDNPAQGPCPKICGVPNRRGSLRQAGRASELPAALFWGGPFDGRRGHAARRACRHRGVRTLRVVL